MHIVDANWTNLLEFLKVRKSFIGAQVKETCSSQGRPCSGEWSVFMGFRLFTSFKSSKVYRLANRQESWVLS